MDLVTQQREERRQRILNVARLLMADRGYDGVTMRELAEESLVSVPTLYNLFGGKNGLLFAAVESYFLDLMRNAERDGREEGLSRIISLAEVMGREPPRHAAYSRSLMSFFGGPSDKRGLHEFISDELSKELIGALEQMQAKRQLATWADPRALGERIASQLVITTFEWARQQLSDQGLRGAMLYGISTMLLGLARGKATAELERLVRKHQGAAIGRKRPRQYQTGTD